MSIYVDLTREFNAGALRAVLSSGQAAVLHKLAIMSKDGDWILREDTEALSHILMVLDRHGARYRFGAPLDVPWLAGGWSSHFEFREESLRIRTDFVTRPPRLSAERLAAMWQAQTGKDLPFVDARDLAELKKTNREKDYAVIGELARLLASPADQLLLSRSARDLANLARKHGNLIKELAEDRPLLNVVSDNVEKLEAALDAERRTLIHANERRLMAYIKSAQAWEKAWPDVAREVANMGLTEAHAIVTARAKSVLPYDVGDTQ